MKTAVTLITLMLILNHSVQAQIYSYTNVTSGAPASVSSYITATNLTRVNGAQAATAPCSSGFSSTNFGSTTSYNPTFITYKGIEITLTPDPSYKISITSFSAGIRRSGSGPAYLRYAYSLNGGITWTDQGSNQSPNNSSCGSTITGSWDMADFSSMSPIKIVIYGFNATSTAGVLQLLDVKVFGAVTYVDDDFDDYGAGVDCNDMNETIFPDALESCNGMDEDCNGVIDNFPVKTWSAKYTGTENIEIEGLKLLPNGNVIVIANMGDYYYSLSAFMAQFTADGHLEWINFYNNDYYLAEVNDFKQTADGGYILAGFSDTTGYDYYDGWIIKTDAIGNIQWQRNFGGTSTDLFNSILETPDGGFIVGGSTYSIDGEATGNHGNNDALIIKLDGTGNVQWSKLIGGSGKDSFKDFGIAEGGGYIIGCETSSTDQDGIGNHGSTDMLIMKIDDSGNNVWSRILGSSGSDNLVALKVNEDGGCIGGGNVKNGDGNVIGYHGGTDEWVFKLDQFGNLDWQHALGGTLDDYIIDIVAGPDGGFLIAGRSRSSDGDLAGTIPNDYKIFIMKMDELGNAPWMATFGSSPSSYGLSATSYSNGKWAIAWSKYQNSAIASFTENGSMEWIRELVPNSNYWSAEFYSIPLIAGNETGAMAVGNDLLDAYGIILSVLRIQTAPETIYADADGDGFGNAQDSIVSMCNTFPAGYVTDYTDCNDTNGAVNPVAAEVCNNLDDNCNGAMDDSTLAFISPAGNVAICKGGTLTLTANAGTDIAFQWLKNGVIISGATLQTYIPTKTAAYSVFVANSFNCTATSAETGFTIIDPVASITPMGSLNICETGSVNLQADQSDTVTYQWLKGSNILAGATNQIFTATTKGTFKVTVTNINTGCGKTSAGVKVTKDCKLSEEELLEFSLYPNPASTTFTIMLTGEFINDHSVLEIQNELGQAIMVRQVEASNASQSIEVQIPDAWSNGLYFVLVRTGHLKVVRPLVISRR